MIFFFVTRYCNYIYRWDRKNTFIPQRTDYQQTAKKKTTFGPICILPRCSRVYTFFSRIMLLARVSSSRMKTMLRSIVTSCPPPPRRRRHSPGRYQLFVLRSSHLARRSRSLGSCRRRSRLFVFLFYLIHFSLCRAKNREELRRVRGLVCVRVRVCGVRLPRSVRPSETCAQDPLNLTTDTANRREMIIVTSQSSCCRNSSAATRVHHLGHQLTRVPFAFNNLHASI